MPLNDLFFNFQAKQINIKYIRQFIKVMQQQKLNVCTLWRTSPLTRLITGTAKLQSFFVILAGLLFIPSTLYQKYQEDKSKLWKICIYSPIATAFVLTPFILYRRNVRKMLVSINYNLKQNKFQLQTYKKQTLLVNIENLQIVYNPKRLKIIHHIQINQQEKKPRIFTIEGYGQWDSLELFKYIVEKKSIELSQEQQFIQQSNQIKQVRQNEKINIEEIKSNDKF